ncbi:GAF domain-containing sensor histidine kinase [Nitrospirillum pindoramense]|uniref:histidine kinase n=1 Tax=Nitrospirillum amazonense TaxID=28077 RepID=A0A560GVQ9_9PROT|nr:ATP-binding protein [Nitrospirillum amazonense]TWB38078.1 signal transduction histidine kinase [Nitrospirillum amazonense]
MMAALAGLAVLQLGLAAADMRAAWGTARDAQSAHLLVVAARDMAGAMDAQSSQWTAAALALRAPGAALVEELAQRRRQADRALDAALDALPPLPALEGARQRLAGVRQELAGLRRAADQSLNQPFPVPATSRAPDSPPLRDWLAGERALATAESRMVRELVALAAQDLPNPDADIAADALAARRDADLAWADAVTGASAAASTALLLDWRGATMPASDVGVTAAMARFATALAGQGPSGPEAVQQAGQQAAPGAAQAALADIGAVATRALDRWAAVPPPAPAWAAVAAGAPLAGAALLTLVILVALRQGVFGAVSRTARLMRDLAEGRVAPSPAPVPGTGRDETVAELHSALALYWSHARRIERETQRRERAERLLTVERKVLGMTAGRAPLSTVLSALCSGMEADLEGGLCSIVLVDADGRHIRTGAAPSLPASFARAVDGAPVGPVAGSCGTAIHRGEPVIVTDIANDPLWQDYRAAAAEADLAACWSIPILAGDGHALGAFAIYFRSPRSPEGWMLDLARRASRLATVAISAERGAEELERAKAAAELGNRTKTEFLANMSHELRTPLNAIIGFAEVLEGDLRRAPDQVTNAGYAGDIVASGRHLLAIINDILDVSKIEAGKVELRERVCDVAALVAGCERIARGRALEKRIDLVTTMAPDLPPLLADDVKIKQILLNLLSNAVKFTEAGGRVSLTATINAEAQMVIAVSDTGIGIADADLSKVFVPFQQIDNVYARTTQGTGLGLSLSKGLAELHGGRLDIVSRLGQGTTVSLVLPSQRLLTGGVGDTGRVNSVPGAVPSAALAPAVLAAALGDKGA